MKKIIILITLNFILIGTLFSGGMSKEEMRKLDEFNRTQKLFEQVEFRLKKASMNYKAGKIKDALKRYRWIVSNVPSNKEANDSLVNHYSKYDLQDGIDFYLHILPKVNNNKYVKKSLMKLLKHRKNYRISYKKTNKKKEKTKITKKVNKKAIKQFTKEEKEFAKSIYIKMFDINFEEYNTIFRNEILKQKLSKKFIKSFMKCVDKYELLKQVTKVISFKEVDRITNFKLFAKDLYIETYKLGNDDFIQKSNLAVNEVANRKQFAKYKYEEVLFFANSKNKEELINKIRKYVLVDKYVVPKINKNIIKKHLLFVSNNIYDLKINNKKMNRKDKIKLIDSRKYDISYKIGKQAYKGYVMLFNDSKLFFEGKDIKKDGDMKMRSMKVLPYYKKWWFWGGIAILLNGLKNAMEADEVGSGNYAVSAG